jgi:hypothetical protein
MFIWDDKPRPFKHANERRQQMYKKELEDRAALLMRLGHSAKDVKSRLKKSVDWDFDMHDAPEHADNVDKLVDGVFKRNQR